VSYMSYLKWKSGEKSIRGRDMCVGARFTYFPGDFPKKVGQVGQVGHSSVNTGLFASYLGLKGRTQVGQMRSKVGQMEQGAGMCPYF
jgi:hypothetical protein